MLELEYILILKDIIGDAYWYKIFVREYDEEFGKEVGYAMTNLQSGEGTVETILKPNAIDSGRVYKKVVQQAKKDSSIIGKRK